MKFYNDKNKVIMVQTIASANTFISSITGIIKNRLLKVFPTNYFRGNVYVDTAETFTEANKNKLYNNVLNKIRYPSLTITPSLSINDSVSGMKNILMSSPNLWLPRDINRVYPYLIDDPNEKYKIYYSSDYISFNLRFKIITDSFIQATNIGYFLKSRFDDSLFKYLNNQLIQTEVPKSFINAIAKIEGIFTGDHNEVQTEDERYKLDKLLLQIGVEDTPIIRKKSLNTGKDCYFFNKVENLFTLFADLDIPESVIRDNSINGEYEISFRIQISAWWPNAFIMEIDKDKYQTIVKNISFSGSDNSSDNNSFYSTNIGIISLDRKNVINFTDSTNAVQVGQNILHTTLTFSSENKITSLNFSYLLSPLFLKVHSYAKNHNLNLTELYNVIARTYSFNDATLGKVDYENMYLDFDNPIDTDIVLDVFLNKAMFQSILKHIEDDTFYKNEYALSILKLNYYDDNNQLQEYKVRVYAFKNDDEMYSTDLNKSLRVCTPYGIGYVGLVREGNLNASNIKICLGQDKYGNNIIRCLEKI